MSNLEVRFDARFFVVYLMSRENPNFCFFFPKEEPNVLRYKLKPGVLRGIIKEAREKNPESTIIQGMIELKIHIPNPIEFDPNLRTIEIELGGINYNFEIGPA